MVSEIIQNAMKISILAANIKRLGKAYDLLIASGAHVAAQHVSKDMERTMNEIQSLSSQQSSVNEILNLLGERH